MADFGDTGALEDLRAFLLLVHPEHGLVLLQAFKKKKGKHFQLPGGRVDADEQARLGPVEACRHAALRELHEETGIEIPASFSERLQHIPLKRPERFAGRMYFRVDLRPEDAVLGGELPLTEEPFSLLLDPSEHTAWAFERDFERAANAVKQHSGGYNSIAVRETLSIAEPRAAPPKPPPLASGVDTTLDSEKCVVLTEPPLPRSMRLKFSFNSIKSSAFVAAVESSDSVEITKRKFLQNPSLSTTLKVHGISGVSPAGFDLVLDGEVLENGRSLHDCGVKEDTVLNLNQSA